MANTTNFGWETPDDTDLVKDGAAAIRTLAGAIDTSMVDLKGGTTGQVLSKATNTDMDFTWIAQDDSNAIQNAIVDAKGDLISATAADTPARLAVGTNGQVLTVDSTEATGLKWATASSGGLTLLDTKTANNSVTNYTFTSISGSYKNLLIVGEGLQSGGNGAAGINIQYNSDTSGNYFYTRIRGLNTSTSVESVVGNTLLYTGNCMNDTDDTQGWGQCEIMIYNYAGTSNYKSTYSRVYCAEDNTTSNCESNFMNGSYNSTSAITSIKLSVSDLVNNFKSGTLKLYGVS